MPLTPDAQLFDSFQQPAKYDTFDLVHYSTVIKVGLITDADGHTGHHEVPADGFYAYRRPDMGDEPFQVGEDPV